MKFKISAKLRPLSDYVLCYGVDLAVLLNYADKNVQTPVCGVTLSRKVVVYVDYALQPRIMCLRENSKQTLGQTRGRNSIDNQSVLQNLAKFVPNILYTRWILLKFGTEHDSVTAVLCAKFQNDSSSNMTKRDYWSL